MEHWNEIRTAYVVAKTGNLSNAADELGLHRATVARHVERLESVMGVSLFHRHARGYSATEAGRDLLQVARAAEDQFQALEGRIRGQSKEVSGELIITSIDVLAPLILEAVKVFRDEHPATRVRYVSSSRKFRLEYGEAHVAIRGGSRPTELDNVVQPFVTLQSGLYAHSSYVASRGRPESVSDFASHDFVENPNTKHWATGLIPPDNIVFASSNERCAFGAMHAGVGIAFFPKILADRDPELVEVHAPMPEWDATFWIVTHVDLHRTAKVQAITQKLRDVAGE